MAAAKKATTLQQIEERKADEQANQELVLDNLDQDLDDMLGDLDNMGNEEIVLAASNPELNVEPVTQAPVAETPAAAATPAEPKKTRPSIIGLSRTEALAHLSGAKFDDLLLTLRTHTALSDEDKMTVRTDLLAEIEILPKKINEKVQNLFSHLSRGVALSNYTRIAIALLMNTGELTSKSLKEAYIARHYGDGTASSQTTQMMKLLPVLNIARKEAGKLVPNTDSAILALIPADISADRRVSTDDAE